jgi:hypothetical protein
MAPIIVIYHNADYDGIFCREIAKKFFENEYPGKTEYIGWNYGDPVPEVSQDSTIYMLDISIPELMDHPALNWIDHHKSAIDRYHPAIPGYRIDGVAACRLTWQYLFGDVSWVKVAYERRRVLEPYAVTLAGEYDIWDHKPSNGDDIDFQFALDACPNLNWDLLLEYGQNGNIYVSSLLTGGRAAKTCIEKRDANVIRHRSFMLKFEGLIFLALCTARCNSNSFVALDKPSNGHDALMGFYFDGEKWNVSMYQASFRTDLDLSKIAVKHGGGGHRGACGFESAEFPFTPKQVVPHDDKQATFKLSDVD